MKIAILGASGTTGGMATRYALELGYEVVAYVRNPASMAILPGLRIVAGSVEDDAAMAAAFEDVDAVISCLGVRPSLQNIWQNTDFQQRTLPKILSAVDKAGVRRFVLMSSFGIGEQRYKASFIPRVLFYTLIAKRLFDDKAFAERALTTCRADWTAVYPVTLKDGEYSAFHDLIPMEQVAKIPGIPVLTFATVAKILVDVACSPASASRKLLLTPKGAWS